MGDGATARQNDANAAGFLGLSIGMSDAAYNGLVLELLCLTDGLESGSHRCACGRYYRLGIAHELAKVLEQLRPEALRRAEKSAEECPPDSTRFAFLEVD